MRNKIRFGALLIVLSSLVFTPIIGLQAIAGTAGIIEVSPEEVSFICPVNCKCDSAGNVISCEAVVCPVNCKCDSAGNVISCEGKVCPVNCTCDANGNVISCEAVVCPVNCKCDSEGNVIYCEGKVCPVNCTCDANGNIISCEGVVCPVNCKCDSEGNVIYCEGKVCPVNCTCDANGNIISCEGVVCPVNCKCDSEGNVIECKSSVCPEGCVCKGNFIACPSEETKPTRAIITISTGSHPISIEKISENKIGLKSKNTIAETSEKLIVKESKLYLDTSVGEKQISILPEEASSKATEVTTVKKIELKEEASVPIYSVKGTKQAKLLFVIPVSMQIETKVSAESGNVISVKKPWWSFLAW